MKLLVIGGDSLIGAALLRAAQALAWQAVGTTRRKGASGHAFLDLTDPAPAPVLRRDFDAVVVCAAVSRHDRCTADPHAARLVNVEGAVRVALDLAGQGAHVVFLSTDSVFGENNCLRRERDAVSPGARSYPRLKAQAESLLLDTVPPDQLAIVRLTKVVSAQREPFSTWCGALRAGARIEGLSDLMFSPVSLRYAANALLQLCASGEAGIFHLSGERDLSYAEFAWEVSARAGGASAVSTRSMAEAGVQPAYRPSRSCLGMNETTRRTGLQPQPVAAVVDDLMAESLALDQQNEQGARACVTAA